MLIKCNSFILLEHFFFNSLKSAVRGQVGVHRTGGGGGGGMLKLKRCIYYAFSNYINLINYNNNFLIDQYHNVIISVDFTS